MKKQLLLIVCLCFIMLAGCDLRQQFPINYVYNTFAEFETALENLKFSESDQHYNRSYSFFNFDGTEYETSFYFYGVNYGSEKKGFNKIRTNS